MQNPQLKIFFKRIRPTSEISYPMAFISIHNCLFIALFVAFLFFIYIRNFSHVTYIKSE